MPTRSSTFLTSPPDETLAIPQNDPNYNPSRVAYFYHEAMAEFYYGPGHPMKPHRQALTNALVIEYGLHKRCQFYRPRRATREELTSFHKEDYIDFLARVTPENMSRHTQACKTFKIGLGEDCPAFKNMFQFCSIYTGASIEGARMLASGSVDTAINWSGGLHHASKSTASGFCFVNDIVIAILELLRVFPRVMYVDIDIHHGDGVQEAFYKSDRVLTISFHRYGLTPEGHKFFPGTGDLAEIGDRSGKYHSINVPLNSGIDDRSYYEIFTAIMREAMKTYQPSVVVLQCGADSLGGDRLGCFRLSIEGHGDCVEFMKTFHVPLLVLGGGGYTMRNVARCWANETAILTSSTLPNEIPEHAYSNYYRPDYLLYPKTQLEPRLENLNTPRDLERLRDCVFEILRTINHAPSVQQHEVPPDIQGLQQAVSERLEDEEADQLQDERPRSRRRGHRNQTHHHTSSRWSHNRRTGGGQLLRQISQASNSSGVRKDRSYGRDAESAIGD